MLNERVLLGGIVAVSLCVVTLGPVMVTVYVPLLSIENFTEPLRVLQLSESVLVAMAFGPE